MAKTNQNQLLEQRNARSKPAFVVKECAFKPSVKARWRKPRGKHSPVRQYHKGRVKMPHPGYGAPKAVFGLNRSGLKEVVVSNVSGLDAIKENEAVIVSGKVGLKKRIEILRECESRKLEVTIVGKDLSASIKSLESKFAARKESKASAVKAKAEKAKAIEKAAKAEDKKKADEKKEEKSEKAEAKADKKEAKAEKKAKVADSEKKE